ncbi:hypothetical protein LN042_11765, partial [Kitasatospora sp. RB6PN24]|nr:hypothetical protein [Kitasatospora humi]
MEYEDRRVWAAGCWFAADGGRVRLYLGIEDAVRSTRKSEEKSSPWRSMPTPAFGGMCSHRSPPHSGERMAMRWL